MRKKISKILCPYDGTDSSNFAFKNALNLAQIFEAELLVLVCIKDKATFGFFKIKSDKEEIKNQKNWAQRKLSQLKDESEKNGVVMKSKILKCNIISKEIVDFAKKEKVDMIAMSKSKYGTPAEEIYSESTVDRVMNESPCTFILIK